MEIFRQLSEATRNELAAWLQQPDCKDFYYRDANNKILEKSREEKIPKSIIPSFDLLNTWYSNNFVFGLLTNGDITFRPLMTMNGYYTIVIVNKLAELYPNNPPKISFDRYLYWLSNCIIEGWNEEGEQLTKIINFHLNTNLLKGGVSYKPTAWYLLTLVNIFFNIKINYEAFNYPEDFGIYKQVLSNWNTTNLDLVDQLVSEMCDYHIEQSNPKDQENLLEIQFSLTCEYVYAFEILCWLNIRKMSRLENPNKFSHPLMNLNLNKLPEPLLQMPKDRLAEKVLQKLSV